MKFGAVPLNEAVNAILAHKLYDTNGKMIFNKGHILSKADIDVLDTHHMEQVIIMRLDASDIHENEAAERIGKAVAGRHIKVKAPGVGRVNLTAKQRGILHINVHSLELINNIYDGITIATLREHTLVNEGEMVALVKIVPFGVPSARVIDVERIAGDTTIMSIRPLQKKRVALIISGTDSIKERLIERFYPPVLKRIEDWGSELLDPIFVQHETSAIANAICACSDVDLILVASVSAIIDREDIVPSALVQAGGSITLHGVPVDPGSLMMMGYLGELPVIGAPGCIQSPKTNVIDWIIPRLLTGERLTRANLVSMGHGGLLKDIAERPMPRSSTSDEIVE